MKQQGDHIEPINLFVADYYARQFNDVGLLAAFKSTSPEFTQKLIKYMLDKKHLIETEEKPTLIHGDYEPRNLRAQKINDKWEISGVLDFEYSGALMREYDFIKLQRIGFLDEGKIRESFLEGYSQHQTVSKDFDEIVTLFRNIRDVGFVVYLLKAGNKQLATEILERVKKNIE